MKNLFRLCVGLCLCAAVVPATTVTDTVYMADQSLASGTITIDFPYSCIGPLGRPIAVTRVPVTVTAGVFTVTLEPNDTCANTWYTATYNLSKGPLQSTHREYWIVPTSSIPVTVAQIRSPQQPTVPTYQFPIAQMTGGTNPGDLIVYSGTSFVRMPVCSGNRVHVSDSTKGQGWDCIDATSARTSEVNTIVRRDNTGSFSIDGITAYGSLSFSGSSSTLDASSAGKTKPFRSVTTLPATCDPWEFVIKADGTPGQNLYQCSGGWTLYSGAGGSGEPAGSTPRIAFTDQTTLVIPASVHGLGACPDVVYTSTNDGTSWIPNESWSIWTCNATTYAVTVQFSQPTSGYYKLAVGGGGVGGGGGDLGPATVGTSHLDIDGTLSGGSYFRVNPSNTAQFQYRTASQVLGDIGAAAAIHAARHQNGGADEIATATPGANAIPKAGGAGTLAAGWIPDLSGTYTTPGALGSWTGSTSITTLGTVATGTIPYSLLSSVPSTFTPAAHASAHKNGGGDEIATETPAANAIPKAGAGGTLAAGWCTEMVGDSGSGGVGGCVPAPAPGDASFCFKGNGEYSDCGTAGTYVPNFRKSLVSGATTITQAEHGYVTPAFGVQCYDSTGVMLLTHIHVDQTTFDVDVSTEPPTDGYCVVLGTGDNTISLAAAGDVVALFAGGACGPTEYLLGSGGCGTPPGGGDVIAPAVNTDNYLPQWNGANSKTLKDGLAVASANTASAVVARDGSGNFSAGTISANLTGDVTGNASGTAANVTGTVAVANGGTGLTGGTSGGVPYYSGAATIASSAALAASTIVLGGGAGAAPTTTDGYTIATAGSAGTASTNAGSATSLARSDHEHLVPWQVGQFFEVTPSTGIAAIPLPVNSQCGGSIGAVSVSVVALTQGSAFTFNVVRYAADGSTVGNLFSSTQTYNTAGTVRQGFSTDANNTGLAATDYFRVNVVSITGTDDFSMSVSGTCKNR